MNLDFLWMELKQFKCVKKPLRIDFNDLPVGVHFLRGKNLTQARLGANGVGKSTLWDALCWCLTGKTVKGMRNPDVIPWAGGSPVVAVALGVDGEERVIVRKANPNSVTLDGKTCSNEDIENLTGLPYHLLTNTVILGQGRPLFLDLKPEEKMQLFTDVLGLEKWEIRSALASHKANEMNASFQRMDGELSSLADSITELTNLLKRAKRDSEEWEEVRGEKVKRLKRKIKETRGHLEGQAQKKAQAELTYDGAATEVKLLRNEQAKILPELNELRKKYQQSDLEIDACKQEIENLVKELSYLSKAETCPTCGQPVKKGNLKSHRKVLKEHMAELEARVKAGIPKKLIKQVNDLNIAYSVNDAKQRELEEKAMEARNEVDALTPRVAELNSELRRYEEQLDELDGQDDPYRDQRIQLKKRLRKLESKEQEICDELDALERRLKHTQYWAKGFKEIRLMVIEEVLQDLELTTQATLEDVGLVGWQVRYKPSRETKAGTTRPGLHVEILSPENDTFVRWESWSGGEGQRLRLVGALALSEVLLSYAGVTPDLEILDEPTRSLSPEGIRDLGDFLAERSKRLQRLCMYTDHGAVESSRFASVITVVKDEQGSHL